MTLSMLAIHQAAQNLLDCVCTAVDALPLSLPGLAGCPCRVGVVPAAPAADGCDGGCSVGPGEWPGQLTVNVVRLFATDAQTFPREVGPSASAGTGLGVRSLKNCAMPQVTAVELLVTLFRCVPGPTDEGCPPSMAELDAAAMQYHADMLAVQQGVLCCFAGTDTSRRNGRRYVMGQTTTIGPAGACVGFQTRVTVALDDSLPPVPVAALVAVESATLGSF
jgi:hypothetical protein